MWKFVGSLCLFLAACATGGVPSGAASHANVRFALVDRQEPFPVAKNPQLPSADRMSRLIASEFDEVASADVRLCVAPDGHVEAVQLVRGSSIAEFDAAVLHDMTEWQFSGSSGSRMAARACEVATITYRPYR
jgi:TonB family protein